MILYLTPGEEISSPSVCILYCEGNEPLKGNNLFGRYMREVISPKWNGKEPFAYALSRGSSALKTVNEKNQVDYIQRIARMCKSADRNCSKASGMGHPEE
jgi:hypothetical protein